MRAPRMVVGSMTRMSSQSMRGLSKYSCRRPTLNRKFDIAPPTIVIFDSATAVSVLNPADPHNY